jgi:hypothetical protein
MLAMEVILLLLLVRVMLPVGLMLWLGEWIRQRETHY